MTTPPTLTEVVRGPLLARALARYGEGRGGTVRALGFQGAANETYAVGTDAVLRVARPGFAADLALEGALLPLLAETDVPAPTVLAQHLPVDAGDADVVGRPWMLQRRMPGESLATADLSDAARQRAYGDLGRALRDLHTQVSLDAALRAAPQLVLDDAPDPMDTVRRMTDRHWMGPGDAAWLAGWFEHLQQWQPDTVAPVLLHEDASPTNVLVDPVTGALTALLDWGDAFCSDPAVDLAKVPGPHLPATVTGYAGGTSDELVWAARALRHQLAWALRALQRPPRPDDPAWSSPPAARLLNLTRLALQLPETWRRLLPRT